jgi:hypothetical protein
MPRRWHQVGGNDPLMMVARKPDHQGELEAAVKTNRAEKAGYVR